MRRLVDDVPNVGGGVSNLSPCSSIKTAAVLCLLPSAHSPMSGPWSRDRLGQRVWGGVGVSAPPAPDGSSVAGPPLSSCAAAVVGSRSPGRQYLGRRVSGGRRSRLARRARCSLTRGTRSKPAPMRLAARAGSLSARRRRRRLAGPAPASPVRRFSTRVTNPTGASRSSLRVKLARPSRAGRRSRVPS